MIRPRYYDDNGYTDPQLDPLNEINMVINEEGEEMSVEEADYRAYKAYDDYLDSLNDGDDQEQGE